MNELISISDFEKNAADKLPRGIYDFYAGGANDMVTLRENKEAFSRLKLMPRIWGRSVNCTETTVLGEKISSPICIAPTAAQRMAHNDGECATSKASARCGTLMCLSTNSTVSLEEVATSAPGGLRWFQLYIFKDREVTLDLVHRAEKAGYKALVVTADTPLKGRRELDFRNNFFVPAHLTMANFPDLEIPTGVGVNADFDPNISWKDIEWLRENTSLKIVIKGVMRVDDALACIQNGVDGIWVSNHGGRQLDSVPATIEVLSEICQTVAGRMEVYMDGGIVRGTDVLKAIALGATAVFIGRPILWGLTHSGEEGVYDILKLLNDELVLAMKLSGCATIADIDSSIVRSSLSFQGQQI